MYEELLQTIKDADYIAIVTHSSPDGDTIGSALGLYHSFLVEGIKSVVVNSEEIPKNLRYLHSAQKIKREVPNGADLVLVVDTGAMKKIGVDLKGKKIASIDHHKSNEGFADVGVLEPDAASTGEVVYKFLKFAGFTINRPAAEGIFAAIATDTRFFSTNRVDSSTFEVVQDLYNIGIDHINTISSLRGSSGLSKMRLTGEALKGFSLHKNGEVIYFAISKELLNSCGATFEDTADIADTLLENVTARVAVLLIEKEEGVKGSFRSKDEVDVSDLALNFDGGGHKNAAGFFVQGSLEEISKRVLKVVGA